MITNMIVESYQSIRLDGFYRESKYDTLFCLHGLYHSKGDITYLKINTTAEVYHYEGYHLIKVND